MKSSFKIDLDWRHVIFVLWQTIKRFEGMERRKEAAALTYTTLFALVPVLTVSYAMLSAIPALQEWGQDANSQLLTYIMPEGSDMIADYLTQFSQQARKLTWLGIAFLFATCLMLLQTIERQFNRIWNVESSRSRLHTFFRYWAVLSLGPLLFGAAIATSSLLISLPLWENAPSGSLAVLARLVPWLLSVAAISVLYLLVPNCKVPLFHAFLSAILVASTFELGKFGFREAIGMFPSYKLIYGAFAAVPLFLLWIYLSWMILLLGAELCYGLSHYRKSNGERQSPLDSRLNLAALLMSCQVGAAFLSEDLIRRRLPKIESSSIAALLKEFHNKRWAMISEDGCWAWVRDPDTLTVGEFFADQPLKNLQPDENQEDTPLAVWQQGLNSAIQENLSLPLSQILSFNKEA